MRMISHDTLISMDRRHWQLQSLHELYRVHCWCCAFWNASQVDGLNDVGVVRFDH